MMGNMNTPAPAPIQATPINIATRTHAPRPSFFILRVNNTDTWLDFGAVNIANANNTELVNVSIPLFDNICPELDSDTVIINGNAYTLERGLYMSGIDLAAALTELTNPTEGVSWAFNTYTKHLTASASAAFTITASRLSMYYLGFVGDKSGASSYTSETLLNLYPFTGLGLSITGFNDTIMFKDSYGNPASTTMFVPIDTWQWMSKTSMRLDRMSFLSGALYTDTASTIFPIKIHLFVITIDGETLDLPLSETLTADVLIRVN